MASKVTNNAATTLAGSINTVVTTINLAAGTGTLFPILSAGDWFYGTLVDASNNIEIVKVTARATDALTVVRGQDGTTARAYSVGDRFELRPTAALFNDKADVASPTFTGTAAIPTAAVTTLSLGGVTIISTGTELNYVDGVTGPIQTQLNTKAPSSGSTLTNVTISSGVITGITDLAIADGGTGSSTAAGAFANIKQAATTAASGVTRLATGSEAQAGSDSTITITPAALNATVLGMGQSYQDVTGARASGGTYPNSTGRTIAVSAWSTTGGITNMLANAFVNGVLIASNSWYSNGPGYSASVYFLVPPGATYRIDFGNAGVTTKWYELR